MSFLGCFNVVNKKVSFNHVIRVKYYVQTPIETDVDWQQEARDRMRFKRRMLDVEHRIGWVFTEHHRSKVYEMLNM